MSKTRFVIAGIRHYHILEVARHTEIVKDCELTAYCEEDAATREILKTEKGIEVTYDSYDKLLADGNFDVVAIGDTYVKRGGMIIKALQAGKHVVVDKPLCTSLEELDQIEKLSREKNLSVIIHLTLRGNPVFRTLHQLVQSGKLGKIRAASFGGQHPLNFGVRPDWYFTGDQHKGTINDIAVHGVDYLRWITGEELQSVESARCWCTNPEKWPDFKDGAQAHYTLTNGAGVLVDVSYFTPEKIQYPFPLYWRTTLWGSEGVADAALYDKHIRLFLNGSASEEQVPLVEADHTLYIDSLLNEIKGTLVPGQLTTAECLKSSRATLEIQRAADQGKSSPIPSP